MTIVVGAASPDGIVLAADSRTTSEDTTRYRIGTDSAEKVFDLGGKFAAATYGMAFIGTQSINGVMNEFVASKACDACTDVEQCATVLGDFFTAKFDAANPTYTPPANGGWPLGFLVAGYDSVGVGHVWEVGVPGPVTTIQQLDTNNRAVTWRGQVEVIARLIKGWDANNVARGGVTLAKAATDELAKLEYVLMLPLTLRDAADFASFLVRTTIDMQRFSDGTSLIPNQAPGCGGSVQLIASTADGTKWLQRRDGVQRWRPGLAEGAVDSN
jgi:hypothetical protein